MLHFLSENENNHLVRNPTSTLQETNKKREYGLLVTAQVTLCVAIKVIHPSCGLIPLQNLE